MRTTVIVKIFYVLLTVHLRIMLATDLINAQILVFIISLLYSSYISRY